MKKPNFSIKTCRNNNSLYCLINKTKLIQKGIRYKLICPVCNWEYDPEEGLTYYERNQWMMEENLNP